MIKLLPILITAGTLVISMLIVKFYSLSYWGELAVLLNVAIFFGSISSLRIENSIFSRKKDSSVNLLLSSGIKLALLAHLLIVPVFLFWFDNLSLLIISLSTGLLNILQVYNLKKDKVLLNYSLNGLYTFLPYLQILIFKPEPSYVGLTYLVSLLCNVYLLRTFFGVGLDRSKIRRVIRLSSLQWKYTFPQTVVNLLRVRMIYLFLPLYFSNSEIGNFNLIERIAGAVASTVALVLRPIYIKVLNRGTRVAKDLNSLMYIFCALYLLALVIVVTVPNITYIAKSFDDSISKNHLLMLLSLSYVMAFVHWADKLYEYIKKQKVVFLLECASVPLFILSALLFKVDLPNLVGVIAVFYIIYNVLTLRFMKNHIVLIFHLLTLMMAWIIIDIY